MQEHRPTEREDNEAEPDSTRIMPWPLQRKNTSSLLQQLHRHIKNREKRYNKKVQTYPQTPQMFTHSCT